MNSVNTTDVIANLLSNEKLIILRKNTSTASFNIETRILTLPIWHDIPDYVEQLLILHEVGHALYTTSELSDALGSVLPFPEGQVYLNVVEDARIEKLIKRRYPGAIKVINKGYDYLNKSNFFNIEGKDLDLLHTIDKLNIFFKIGIESSFTPKEQNFIDRISNAETVQDAIDISIDLFNYCKDQKDSFRKKDKGNDESESDNVQSDYTDQSADQSEIQISSAEDDSMDSDSSDKCGNQNNKDNDCQPDESNCTSSGSGDENGSNQIQQPFTQASVDSNLSNIIENKGLFISFIPPLYDYIIPYKEIYEESLSEALKYRNDQKDFNLQEHIENDHAFNKFKTDLNNDIAFMIKEFEMRKAAAAHKRQQISKTGQLDPKKLWGYKIKEDLFKAYTTTKDGKNHGMVFLLDWSSSMRPINSTIDQLISLVVFCRKMQIPFKVLAFSNEESLVKSLFSSQVEQIADKRFKLKQNLIEKGIDVISDLNDKPFYLLEFFSSDMSQYEFNTAIYLLKKEVVVRRYKLHSTPLNNALLTMYDYIATFLDKSKTDILTFVVLTDGQGEPLPQEIVTSKNISFGMSHHDFFKIGDKYYRWHSYAAEQTRIILSAIKSKYHCNVIGFHLIVPHGYAIRGNINVLFPSHELRCKWFKDNAERISLLVYDSIKKKNNSQGYYLINDVGYDKLFIISKDFNIDDYEKELNILEKKASTSSIVKKFNTYMSGKKTSRKLLTAIVDNISKQL